MTTNDELWVPTFRKVRKDEMMYRIAYKCLDCGQFVSREKGHNCPVHDGNFSKARVYIWR